MVISPPSSNSYSHGLAEDILTDDLSLTGASHNVLAHFGEIFF